MIFSLKTILISVFIVGITWAQNPPSSPAADMAEPAGQQPVPPPKQGVEELLDASGLVLNKNTFIYDGNEGRDPFKVYREYMQSVPTAVNGNANSSLPTEKNIRSIIVPDDIVVQGILYKKKDPVALVVIKGMKGLNKLRVNSLVGRNEGKVIEIRSDKIVIEQVKEFDGQRFVEKVVLEVRSKKN